jgi:hypothetical protein
VTYKCEFGGFVFPVFWYDSCFFLFSYPNRDYYGSSLFIAGKLMGSTKEKRRCKRLPLRFSVLCQKVGVPPGKAFAGISANVSQGGMLLDINTNGLDHGQLLSVEMSVPPTEGLLQYGGRFSSYARIVRVDKPCPEREDRYASAVQTIALEFCEPPKLRV